MYAMNINGFDFYATGRTVFDDGRVIEFDEFVNEPIVCPKVHRQKDCTITYLTCDRLTAADHEWESGEAASHFEQI